MKKLNIATLTVIFTALPMSIFAKDLPFIGEKYFYNYSSHAETTAKIDEAGNTSIKSCGNAGCSTDYHGKYKKIISLRNGVYVKLTSSHVFFTDSKGKLLRDCNGGNIYKTGCIVSYD